MTNSKIFIKSIFIAFAIFGLLVNQKVAAMEEKYSEQGHSVVRAMHQELIEKGFCTNDFKSFFSKIPLYGGHGNQVNFQIYKPDRDALAAIFDFLVRACLKIREIRRQMAV